MSEITASEIQNRIGPAQPPHGVGGPDVGCGVFMTGGGVATIMMGEEDAEGYALVCIGPGTYDPAQPGESTFNFAELFVGIDDDTGTGTYVKDMDELVAAVARWLPEAIARRRRAAGDWTEAELAAAWTRESR
jgi:hypothetical protein